MLTERFLPNTEMCELLCPALKSLREATAKWRAREGVLHYDLQWWEFYFLKCLLYRYSCVNMSSLSCILWSGCQCMHLGLVEQETKWGKYSCQLRSDTNIQISITTWPGIFFHCIFQYNVMHRFVRMEKRWTKYENVMINLRGDPKHILTPLSQALRNVYKQLVGRSRRR